MTLGAPPWQAAAPPGRSEEGSMKTPLRVLVVEDCQEDADLVALELRRSGFEVEWRRVQSGETMREALSSETWEVVISDDSMPGFDSAGALAVVKDLGIDLPLIIVSGTIGEDRAVESMRKGAADYILKGNLKRLGPAVRRELREAVERRERREAERRRRTAEEQYRILVEAIPAVTYIMEAVEPGRTRYVSPQIEQYTGYSAGEWLAQPDLWKSRIHPDDRARVVEELSEMLEVRGTLSSQYRILNREGQIRWWHTDARFMKEVGEETPYIRGFIEDVTERVQAEESIRHMAYYDRLVDLPNRTLFEHFVDEELRKAEDDGPRPAVLIVSLERFADIVNTLGHRNADEIRKEVARRLKRALARPSSMGKLGGDNFGVLLTDADEEAAAKCAKELLLALQPPVQIQDLPIDVEATIGISLVPPQGGETDVILRRAEVAVYLARKSESEFAFYAAELDPHSPRQLQIMGDLRRGIEANDLFLVYQPKVDVRTRRTTGVEALARWNHRALGLIPPMHFIPAAERTGLIKPFTSWVLIESMRQCRDWIASGPPLTVAINISAKSLHDVQLPDQIAGLLGEWRVPSEMVVIEITETAVLSDALAPLKVLHRLSDLGMKIAIDDFGTGYSSLTYLRKVPASEVKIDRSFTSGIATNREDATIVRSMIDLAHDLGLTVTAEGVETPAAWDVLTTFGCDTAQGFMMGKPMVVADLATWLNESPWGIRTAALGRLV
jgi:diguanylate cyclase (GGDEF)-like protein/PAS domain S-box-containing protein